MGRMLLFLIVGIGGLFSITNFNLLNSNTSILNTSIEQLERAQARAIAESGVEYAAMQLGQDTTWTGIDNLAMSDGSLYVTVTTTNSQFPDAPSMGLWGMRQVLSVGIVNEQEDTVMMVLELTQLSTVPPFMTYAVASENDLAITGAFAIRDDANPDWNSNVHTNSDLVIGGGGYAVEGFGSYTGSMRRDHGHGTITNNFVPNVNPESDPTTFQQDRVDIPSFNPDDYLSIATDFTYGDLSLSGTTVLGTKENPKIWYVEGNLDFRGTTEGYGVFIVKGDISFHGNITVNGLDAEGSNLAFYTQSNIDIHGNTTIYGQMYAEGDITSHGSFELHGSMTSQSTIDLQGGGTIYYRPATSELTDQFWDSSEQAHPQIASYYHK